MADSVQWRAVVNAVLYIVQFQPTLNSESTLDQTAAQLRERPLLGQPVEASVRALREALDSGEQLTGTIPQPHDEASVRDFLTRLADRLAA